MVNNDDNTAKQNISPKTLVCVLLGFFTFSYSLNKQKKNITRRIEFDRSWLNNNATPLWIPLIRIVVKKVAGSGLLRAWET